MQDASWQQFSERVAYDDGLHVSCVALTEPLGDLQRTAIRDRNLSVLGTLAVFNERRSESLDEESQLGQDMQRLDSKLNVLMAMLDQLLQRDAQMTPFCAPFPEADDWKPGMLPSTSVKLDAVVAVACVGGAGCVPKFEPVQAKPLKKSLSPPV